MLKFSFANFTLSSFEILIWNLVYMNLSWLGVKRYTVGIPRYTSLSSVHSTGRIRNGTITVRIRFYLKEIFCFNWHRICFVYKSAGSKQLCTIKLVVYLDVSDIQNTNLGQLCSLYCKASILKVFKDLSTGYVVRSEEINDFFSV